MIQAVLKLTQHKTNCPQGRARAVERTPYQGGPEYQINPAKSFAWDEQKNILSQMEVKDAVVIKDLITYKEETAGGLMVPNFNSVKENQTASEILMQLKHENNSENTEISTNN